jgi:Cu(I)/Ag(I) efflux system periplasmic protein CusF
MKLSILVALSLAFSAAPVLAQSKADHDAHHARPAQAADAAPLAEGEVRRVDKDAKKITIKHGPLESLDMPPMTMVFQVSDPAMLEQVKAGDKVKFQAEKNGGALTVTRLEPAS